MNRLRKRILIILLLIVLIICMKYATIQKGVNRYNNEPTDELLIDEDTISIFYSSQGIGSGTTLLPTKTFYISNFSDENECLVEAILYGMNGCGRYSVIGIFKDFEVIGYKVLFNS